jgi:hypothetical protein
MIIDIENITKLVDELADAAAQDSIGSLDYAINAKAIALSSPFVKNILVSVLSEEYRLAEITPLTGFGSILEDYRLLFRFHRGAVIDMPAKDFVAVVNIPGNSVKHLLDSRRILPPPMIAAPFALAVPS